jgi:hypothetical protein
MHKVTDTALQEQLFQDLLEINQEMARGAERVLDTILHKGARLVQAEHGSIRDDCPTASPPGPGQRAVPAGR